MAEMYKVKLTVLKTAIYPELAEKYLSIGKELKPCGGFKEGQEMIVDAFMNCPEGFCAQAWAALYPQMLTISRGGSYAPWTKEDGVEVGCCTDGLRPVTFLIERDEVQPFDV